MRKAFSTITAFIRLVRVPNLAIIVVTQLLLRYGIQKTFLFHGDTSVMSGLPDFLLLMLVTVFIAMGGYVINDYFDVQIDSLNKPEMNVVGRHFSVKVIMNIYITLTGLGILCGFYLAFRIRSLTFGLIFPFIAGLLWFYSERYKKMLFRGNFIVAILSAMVILIVWYFEFLHLRQNPRDFSQVILDMKDANFFFLFYAFFAFLCTLVREIIKDMEDMEGDREFGCNTLPIAIGINRSKLVVDGLVVITILMLLIAQSNFSSGGYTFVVWYLMVAVQLPLLVLLFRLFQSRKKDDYRFLSQLSKLIMVAGILSIQLLSITL